MARRFRGRVGRPALARRLAVRACAAAVR